MAESLTVLEEAQEQLKDYVELLSSRFMRVSLNEEEMTTKVADVSELPMWEDFDGDRKENNGAKRAMHYWEYQSRVHATAEIALAVFYHIVEHYVVERRGGTMLYWRVLPQLREHPYSFESGKQGIEGYTIYARLLIF